MRRLAALVLLLPFTTTALEMPKWTVVDDRACYSFQEAKKLKLFENDCLQLEADYQVTQEDIKNYEKIIQTQAEAIKSLQKANNDLTDLLTKVQKDRDAMAKKAAVARGRSIFGGGLPWLLAGTACAFAGGLYVGYRYGR